ncbi:uncharacterized protein LOC130688896 [Daphnia carinata]|uniref:uncharacterized protein LOC130688896 n=1 Tax=Daphnia carinata TaxID=120202 RepID=UPI00257A0A6E|nr:uncharacterized protein LOC130688896 [Daphnia carinata]
MFSHVMANREEMESFNINSQTKLAQTSSIAQHLKSANKRQSRPDYVVIETLPSKRYKKDIFPESEDVFETSSINSFDPYLSCSSHTSNISSSNQSQPQQQNQQQEYSNDEALGNSNKQRLSRTTEMLKESGLYDVAVRTAALIRENQQSHRDLENLKEETKLFLKDLLNNPENKKISHIFNGLQQGQ